MVYQMVSLPDNICPGIKFLKGELVPSDIPFKEGISTMMLCWYGFGQDSGRSLEELQVPFKHQAVQNPKTILPKSFSTELWYEGNQKNHSRAHDQLVWFNGLFQDSETWVSHSWKWNTIFNGKPSSWASMKLQDIGFAGRPGWILPQETLGAAGWHAWAWRSTNPLPGVWWKRIECTFLPTLVQ